VSRLQGSFPPLPQPRARALGFAVPRFQRFKNHFQNLAEKTRKLAIAITEEIFPVITINLFLVFSARNQFLSPLGLASE
jgi:hypothetical protein